MVECKDANPLAVSARRRNNNYNPTVIESAQTSFATADANESEMEDLRSMLASDQSAQLLPWTVHRQSAGVSAHA